MMYTTQNPTIFNDFVGNSNFFFNIFPVEFRFSFSASSIPISASSILHLLIVRSPVIDDTSSDTAETYQTKAVARKFPREGPNQEKCNRERSERKKNCLFSL